MRNDRRALLLAINLDREYGRQNIIAIYQSQEQHFQDSLREPSCACKRFRHRLNLPPKFTNLRVRRIRRLETSAPPRGLPKRVDRDDKSNNNHEKKATVGRRDPCDWLRPIVLQQPLARLVWPIFADARHQSPGLFLRCNDRPVDNQGRELPARSHSVAQSACRSNQHR